MADELVQTILSIKLNTSDASQTKRGISDIKNQLGSLASEANEGSEAARELAGELENVGKQSKLNVEGLRRTGAALSQIGLGALGGPLSQAGDIAQVIKEIQNLRSTLPALASGAIEAAGGIGPLIVSVGAIAAPAVALTLAFKALTDAIAAQKKMVDDTVNALKTDTDARLQDIETIHNASSQQIKDTLEVQQLKLQEIQQEKAARQAVLADIQAQYAALGSSFDPAKRAALGAAGDAAQKSIDDLTQRENELTSSIKRTTDTVVPEIEKREQETKAIAAQDAELEQQIATRTKEAELIRNGSSKSIQDRIDALTDENLAIVDVINSGKASSDELSKLSDKLAKNNKELSSLNGNVLEAVKAREKAAQAEKDFAEQQTKTVDAYEKYITDVKGLQDKYTQDSAGLEQKRIDNLEKIQTVAVEDAQKLLQDLLQKEADLQQNLQRDLNDLAQQDNEKALQNQINFQREEVRAEQHYQDQISDIKRHAQEQEQDLALSRDFAGIARLRRQTASQISDVSIQAQRDRQDRLAAYQQQQQDLMTSFVQDRAAKIQKYAADLQDAQAQYVREYKLLQLNKSKQIAAVQADYDKQLHALADNLQKQVSLKQQAYIAEVNALQQTSAVKQQILQTEYQQAQALLAQLKTAGSSTTGGSSTIAGRAFGGSLSSLQTALVNEPGSSGRERFRTGGRSYALPGGIGLFTPLRSGAVEANRQPQNISVHIPITVNGAGQSPEKIADLIESKLETTIRGIFANKAS